jgi:hypothetical protein
MQKLIKNTFSTLILSLGLFCGLSAQNCESYLITRQGAELELTNYDKDKKATTKVLHKVVSVNQSGGTTTMNVQTETTELKKNKKVGASNYQAKCENGAYKFQFSSFAVGNSEQMNSMKDFEAKAEGDFIEIPASPQAGQTLQGGQMKIKVLISGTENPMLGQTITVSNRKVEGVEKITSPAGTWECVKITEDVEFKTLFKIQMKSTAWYAKGVGLVKSETYNKNGKLMGSTELTALRK